MSDEGDLAQLVPVVDELISLVKIEYIFKIFGIYRRSVAEHDVLPSGCVREGS